MKDFNPEQFTPQTRSAVLRRVANSAEDISNPAHALAVGVAQSHEDAPMTFLTTKPASEMPPIRRDKADANGPGFPNGMFVAGKGGEQHLDRKSFSRPMRGGVDGKPAGEAGGVEGAFDKYKRLRFGESAHASAPDLLEDYTPDEDDLCGAVLDPLLDAIFNARFAATLDDRFAWLSSALELIDIACECHSVLGSHSY